MWNVMWNDLGERGEGRVGRGVRWGGGGGGGLREPEIMKNLPWSKDDMSGDRLPVSGNVVRRKVG